MIAEPDQGPNQPKYVLPLLQLIQVSAAIQVQYNEYFGGSSTPSRARAAAGPSSRVAGIIHGFLPQVREQQLCVISNLGMKTHILLMQKH
jgi:hypothetical protein